MSFSEGFYAWSKHAPLPSRPDFICNSNIRKFAGSPWRQFFSKRLDHEMNIFFGRPIKIDQYFLYMLVWVLYFYVALLKVKNKPENTSCTNSRKISKDPIRISVPAFSFFWEVEESKNLKCYAPVNCGFRNNVQNHKPFGIILRISILFKLLSFSKNSSTVPLSL